MEELKQLEEMVEELVKKTDFNEIEKTLKEIGAVILTKYEIHVLVRHKSDTKNIVIEPLRIEPYFYKPVYFEDKFMHREKSNGEYFYGPCQRDRFGKLYIHKGYSGVDIVLSDCKDYAFSFLIKRSRIIIDGKVEFPFVKQYDTAKILKKNQIPTDYNEIVLRKKEVPNNAIVFRTIRNGLDKIAERPDFKKPEQDKYSNLMISSLIELKEHTSSQHGFAKGYGGDRAVVEYLKEYKLEHPDTSVKELDRMRRELYPNGTKTEFVKEFNQV